MNREAVWESIANKMWEKDLTSGGVGIILTHSLNLLLNGLVDFGFPLVRHVHRVLAGTGGR
jgi:hypothetical protein